ncbi:hypothetical protein SALBM311S_01891 [Streptomyces alboniger]
MHACGTDPEEFKTVEFYSSHEALLLDYESALTRVDSRTGHLYDVSAHLVWVGVRTRQLDHAHIEFASRIRNPIGIKLGPTTTAEEALQYIERLDPDREPGRLTFIVRMGADKVRDTLPELVEKVSASGATVASTSDPSAATPTRRPPATRPAASTTCSTRSRASSRSTRAWAPTRAASTSSSPVTTSPSVWAAATRSSSRPAPALRAGV